MFSALSLGAFRRYWRRVRERWLGDVHASSGGNVRSGRVLHVRTSLTLPTVVHSGFAVGNGRHGDLTKDYHRKQEPTAMN